MDGFERRWALAGRTVVSLVVAALSLLAAPSLAAACTETWSGPTTGSNSWETAANWTPTGVPGPADDACIQLDGTYTVTMATGQAVNTLTIGALSTGGATL